MSRKIVGYCDGCCGDPCYLLSDIKSKCITYSITYETCTETTKSRYDLNLSPIIMFFEGEVLLTTVIGKDQQGKFEGKLNELQWK